MQMIGKRILLARIKKEQKEDEIISVEEIDHYEVYAVGSDVTTVKKGDKVLYEMGTNFAVDGITYILLEEKDLVCVI